VFDSDPAPASASIGSSAESLKAHAFIKSHTQQQPHTTTSINEAKTIVMYLVPTGVGRKRKRDAAAEATESAAAADRAEMTEEDALQLLQNPRVGMEVDLECVREYSFDVKQADLAARSQFVGTYFLTMTQDGAYFHDIQSKVSLMKIAAKDKGHLIVPSKVICAFSELTEEEQVPRQERLQQLQLQQHELTPSPASDHNLTIQDATN